MLGFSKLGTVVGRNIVLYRMANLFGGQFKVQAHGDCCQHVVEVIAADEVGCYFMPLAILSIFPLQTQERVAGNDFAIHLSIGLVFVLGIIFGLDAFGQNTH